MPSSRSCALLLAVLPLLATACDLTKPKVPGAEQRVAARQKAEARRLRQACGSAETYDRLKALAFDQANSLQAGRTRILDRVQANATVRMENPVAVSHDPTLDVTVCRGRLVLDLPPGVEDAFNGARQLKADIEYAAQAAADDSGLVYQMKGAEPVIYRLAALTLPAATGDAALAGTGDPTPPAAAAARTLPVGGFADAAPAPVPAGPAPRPRPVERPIAPPPPRPVERPVPAEPMSRPAEIAGAARPSFDCGRVTGRVLRAICADPSLAALDRRMSSQFYAALASGGPETRAELRSSRDRFLRFRDRCADAACIAQSYRDRMTEIRDLATGER